MNCTGRPESLGPSALASHCREILTRAAGPEGIAAPSAAIRAGLDAAGVRAADAPRWRRALRETLIEGVAWHALPVAEQLDWLDAIDAAFEGMPDGDPHAAETRALDLTRRLLAEPATLGALLENIPIAVWVYDPEGRPLSMNGEAVRVIGGTADQAHTVLIRSDSEPGVALYHPDGTPYRFEDYPIVRALRGEAVQDEEMIIRTAWRLGIYLINTRPLRDEDGRVLGTVSTAQDVGELKRLEAELERERRVALEASRAKSHVLRALSHDLRLPLNGLSLSAELLLAHARDPADADVRHAHEAIRRSLRHITDLLDDSMSLSRIEAGSMPVDVSRFPLDDTLAECVATVEGLARRKGLELRTELGAVAGVSARTDRVKFKRIVANLLSNAVRYTARGGVTVHAWVEAGEPRVAVEDTGIGIAREDRERIFREFTRLVSGKRASAEGSGLGLSIARGLAGLLGGRIELASEPGSGSTFTFVLPRSVLSEESGGEQPGQQGEQGQDGREAAGAEPGGEADDHRQDA
jgi:signal transduction histidine kinase